MFLHQVDWWGHSKVWGWLTLVCCPASLSQLYWNISWQRDVSVALKQQKHWGNSSVPLAYKLPWWITALKSQLEEIHVNIRAQQNRQMSWRVGKYEILRDTRPPPIRNADHLPSGNNLQHLICSLNTVTPTITAFFPHHHKPVSLFWLLKLLNKIFLWQTSQLRSRRFSCTESPWREDDGMTNVLLKTKVQHFKGCFCICWTDRETKDHQAVLTSRQE